MRRRRGGVTYGRRGLYRRFQDAAEVLPDWHGKCYYLLFVWLA